MKLISLTLLVFSFASCCKKDPEILNTDCIEMQQNQNFKTEDLNQDYTIQFPLDYTGQGLVIEGDDWRLASFLKLSDHVKVNYTFHCITGCVKFYGGPLNQPIPNTIIGSTIDGTTTFDQKLEFCKNDIIDAIFYHNSDDLSFGTLYLEVEDQYLESATFEFKKEKLEEVKSILKTLEKI